VVRKLMGTDCIWDDKWEEKEGLAVGEMERRMVPEEWTIREEALVMERRVPGRESTTFVWVSENCTDLELSQM